MKDERIPFKKAIMIIFCSMLVVGSIAFGGLLLTEYFKNKQKLDSKFTITAIAQTCSGSESLKTVYLAELLGLSADQPSNISQFDLIKAQRRLEANPLIKCATVKKIPPKTIYVDYTMRQPIAFLGDYSNTAIDMDGYLFPIRPFYTPKSLPEITLGLVSLDTEGLKCEEDHGCWGLSLNNPKTELALKIYHLLQKNCCQYGQTKLLKIDTSKAYALSYGQRQIVVIMEDLIVREKGDTSVLCIYPKILRLSPQNAYQELANYFVLNQKLKNDASHLFLDKEDKIIRMPLTIIDLRIPSLAFINQI